MLNFQQMCVREYKQIVTLNKNWLKFKIILPQLMINTLKNYNLYNLISYIQQLPPQVAGQFISASGLGDTAGYFNVHPDTLQHIKYKIFGHQEIVHNYKLLRLQQLQWLKHLSQLKKFDKKLGRKVQSLFQYIKVTHYVHYLQVKVRCFQLNSNITLNQMKHFLYFNQIKVNQCSIQKGFLSFCLLVFIVKGLYGGRNGFRFFIGV